MLDMATRRIEIVSAPAGVVADLRWGCASTPVGPATIAWSPQGIRFLTCGPVERRDAERWCGGDADHREAGRILARVFDDQDAGPFHVAVSGTAFQLSVWRALCAIPAGRPIPYGALAAIIKRPRASRAVGAACGANPVAVLIPCHRVIAGDGGLGGYSGGLGVKQRLLAWEGRAPARPA